MHAALVLLLFADPVTAGTVPPLFVAIPDHATAVDGGLSRGVAFGDADGDRFVQVMETAPSLAGGFTEGVNWVDFDNDGDLDLYVANWGGGDQDNAMYRNQAQGTWLKLSLVGSASNRMAVGARVTITTQLAGQSSRQARWLGTTTGYASQNEPILHFGLAGATHIDTLSIDWPSGRRDTLKNVAANQRLHLTEGET